MINFNKSINAFKAIVSNKITHVSLLLVLTTVLSVVMFTSLKTVKIYDGDSVMTVKTSSSDVDTILSNANISLGDYDEAEYDKDGNLVISRNFPVNVVVGEQEETIYISGGTVGELLEDKGIDVGEYDTINYSLDHKLSSGMTIEFTEVEYVYTKKTEAIPFDTKIVYSKDMKKGTTKVVGGTKGEKQITYLQKVVNGEVVEQKVVKESVTKAPVQKTTYIGTKAANSNWVSLLNPEKEIELDSNGRPTKYKKLITGIASAYSPNDGRASATGVVLKAGYIAVNPNMIPYGSKLYIKTANGSIIYGYAIAADTGGFVHMYPDRVVDLFFESEAEAEKFGLRNVEIFILE
ncbi:MAG: DUF348 domain-containing protein [Clostridia bacterium]|nr:DUF348 domain-containing protein [Clostridia bacterium]